MITTSLIIQTPPIGTIAGKEGLDLALVCAAFEHKVNLIFADEGIFHLINSQKSDLFDDKNHDKQLKALEFYDIDKLYAEVESLVRFSLTAEHLLSDVEMLSSSQINSLISQSDKIFSF